LGAERAYLIPLVFRGLFDIIGGIRYVAIELDELDIYYNKCFSMGFDNNSNNLLL